MAGRYSKRAPREPAKAGSRVPASARENFLNSAPTIFATADPIIHRMSGWIPGENLRGVTPPNPNAVSEATVALATPGVGLITDTSAAPEDNTHPIPSDNSSATSQVGIFTGVAIPSVVLGGGVSGQPLPCDAPELHDPSYTSGIGEVYAAPPAAKDDELSPRINDMKDFDAFETCTTNTPEVGQPPEAVVLPEVPDTASTNSVDTVVKNIPLRTSIQKLLPSSVLATQEETTNRAGPPEPVENPVRSSPPGTPPVGLESMECIGEWDAFAGAPTQETKELTPSPNTESRQPMNLEAAPLGVGVVEIEDITHINLNSIGQSKPLSVGEGEGAGGDAIKLPLKEIAAISATFGNDAAPSPECDACHTELELVTQEPASTTLFLDGHKLHIPPPIDDNLNLPSPTKLLPGGAEANTADLRNEDSNSSGLVRAREGHEEEGTPEAIESSSQDTATETTAMEGDSPPPLSDALAVRMEPMAEDGTCDEAPISKSPSQTPTDTTDNYKFPSEELVLARARTAGTVFLTIDDANFEDLQDSDEEIGTVEPSKGSKFHRPPPSTSPGFTSTVCKSAPLTIPIPDTMIQYFFSSEVPAPEWAPLTLYFRGGRIADPIDPDYRFFDQVALLPPSLPSRAFAPKTPLAPDKSQDAPGLIPPEPKEKKSASIYDFIDKIRLVGGVADPQIAINTKSVEDFVEAYYIAGPNGKPLLNNPPRGAIPQVKIQHEWIPTGVVERYRIERVIMSLDKEISPATRAALFWILIERQTERTRALLKFLAEYPEPGPKDVEKKLMSWGYLPEKEEVEDSTTDELDPKELVKLDVLKETEQLLKALEEAAGCRKKLKLLLPSMARYSIHNMGFFGLMGSDKMIELVEELCNCLQMGQKGSYLPSFDVQMGCWGFLSDLKPSVLIARSTSLCDLEYLYVVTQRAEVHPDVFETVARVMAPILKRISKHDGIPFRREIPEQVKRSLGKMGNAQIACYLEAQLPRVVMPTAWELAAPKRARIKRYEEEQARLEAIKLQKRQKVMRARVQYMEEGIPRDLAIRPAEIYSPKRRRRKIREGKARISLSSEEEAGIAGAVGYWEEGGTFGETAVSPTNTKPRVTRKRGREETPDEIAGPSEVSPPGAPTNTGSRSKRVRFAPEVSIVGGRLPPVLHKLSWNTHESDSDASDSSSEGDNSDRNRGRQKSRSEAVRKVTLQARHEDPSGESEDEGPQTRAPILAPKRRMKKSEKIGKARAVLVPSQVSKPVPASATRPPSPVHGTTRGDVAAPGWILPDLGHRSDETGGKQPRKGSARAQKEVRRRGDISDGDLTPETVSTTAQPGSLTPPRPPVPQPLRRSPRKHQHKRVYESDSSSSDEGGDGDVYDPPPAHRNKQNKVPKRAKLKGPRKNKIKAEKQAPPAEIQVRTVKIERGEEGRQPRSPIHREESDISDAGEDDKSQSLPCLGKSLRRHPKRTYECDSSSSDKDGSGDGYVPQTSSNKRTKISEGVSKQDPRKNTPKAEKPPPPTLGVGTKRATKVTAAKKAEVRSAAAKKAAATRAANHQAFVDRVTGELEAEAQRAADSGGYQPGAVTKTQVKDRMKRERERMKREDAGKRLEAAVAKMEQAAEAKQIAAAVKQVAAAEKRAATIAAKKAAISEKTLTRSQSTVATKTTKAKIKKENRTAQEGMAKVKDEHGAEVEEAPSSDEEDPPESKGGIREKPEARGGPAAEEDEEDAELALIQEMTRQEAEEDENQEVAKKSGRKRKAQTSAGTARPRKAKREARAEASPEAMETRQVMVKRRRLNSVKQEASEDPASTLETLLNTDCSQNKNYASMGGHDADQGESSRAGEQDAGKSGGGAAKKGKRRKLKPKK